MRDRTSWGWEPELTDEERRYRDLARELTATRFAPAADELDRTARYPAEHVTALVESGIAGMLIPEEYGGGGASLTAVCSALEEVAYGCASTCGILAVYVLGVLPILSAGTEEQKAHYLRALARDGEAISFALTERGAGSDAGAIETTATRVADGFHLRGEKWFIGNGGQSRYYVVFARTDPSHRRSTAFMVDVEDDGVVVDEVLEKMGIRGTMTSNLRLDCVVPETAMLGEEGRGMRIALGTLDVGRVTLAGQALGVSRAALDAAVDWSLTREAFGAPIVANQGVSFKLADIATEYVAGRMMMYEAAAAYDRGEDVAILGAMTKLFTSEASHRAVDRAVQVHGGYGLCRPQLVERLYRDQRALEIYEGTSEIQRIVISRALTRDGSQSDRTP